MTDYKKFYSSLYGIKWNTKDFDVHHIDRDRSNNDIHNLVLLPKELHRELHRVYNDLDRMVAFNKDPFLTAAKEYLDPFGGYLVSDTIEEFMHILYRCRLWGLKKDSNYGRPIGSESIIVVELDDINELRV